MLFGFKTFLYFKLEETCSWNIKNSVLKTEWVVQDVFLEDGFLKLLV